MNFVTNTDGSITITANVPSVVFTSNGDSPSGTYSPAFNSISPAASAIIGSQVPAISGTVYHPLWLIHTQVGTDPQNILADYKNTLSYQITPGSNTLGVGYNQILTTSSNLITVTVPFKTLIKYNIIAGLYAMLYVGVAYRTPGGQTGTWWAQYDFGSNATTYNPVLPTAPGPISITLTPDNESYSFSWSHSIPGSAPLGGYKLCWGTSPNGPFPNNIILPISAAPPSQTPYYTYTALISTFGNNPYFIVIAQDNGQTPVNTNASNLAVKINYIPSGIII